MHDELRMGERNGIRDLHEQLQLGSHRQLAVASIPIEADTLDVLQSKIGLAVGCNASA